MNIFPPSHLVSSSSAFGGSRPFSPLFGSGSGAADGIKESGVTEKRLPINQSGKNSGIFRKRKKGWGGGILIPAGH